MQTSLSLSRHTQAHELSLSGDRGEKGSGFDGLCRRLFARDDFLDNAATELPINQSVRDFDAVGDVGRALHFCIDEAKNPSLVRELG